MLSRALGGRTLTTTTGGGEAGRTSEHMVAEARGKSALVDAPVLRLCTAALAEGWNGGGHSGGGGGWVPKQLLLEVLYESNVKFCGTMSRKWAVRGAHFMAPAFAAGMVFVSATIDHLTCQTFYNRHLLAIVSELAEGGASARMRPQSQLLQVRLTKVRALKQPWPAEVPEDQRNRPSASARRKTRSQPTAHALHLAER